MNFIDLAKDRIREFISPPSRIQTKEAGGMTITPQNVKNFVVKAVGQIEDSSNGDFASPESDLGEIRDAIAADSYIKLAITKYSQLVFKAGYSIVSDNDAAAEYIQQRFNLMSFMTSTPMDILFQGIAEDLISYSNAFLVKSRADNLNVGGLQAKGVLDTKPVGGYFRVDPTTIQIKRDSSGTIKQYQQQVGNNKKSFKNTDVIHFYIDKKGGAAFGTPRIEAALEDVKMLRKIEGSALRLIYRHASPLLQMKVGIPQEGMMATSQEIKEAQAEIEKVADDGVLITNERTEFNVVGAEGSVMDLANYLKYFEARVFSALCLSTAQAGRGGAKQDADSMDEQVHDAVKFFQRTIETFIENGMINELLLEGGYDPITNVQDKVYFRFEEIDLDTKVKMQTHAMNMFQGNAIPFEEMRTNLGLRSDTVDESRLYANMVQQKNALELLNAKTGGEGSGSTTANAGTSGPDKQQKTSGQAKNTMSPQNQHGTSSAKVKENVDVTESAKDREKITKKNKEDYRKKFTSIYKRYNAVRNDLCEDGSGKDFLSLPLVRDEIGKSLKRYITSEAVKGYDAAIKEAKKRPNVEPRIISAVLDDKVDKHLTEMFKDIHRKLKRAKSRDEREAAFNSSEYRLRFLSEQVASKAYWYAYVRTCAALKIRQVYVDFNEGSLDKKDHNRIIHTDHFSLDDIPAFHPYCRCTLELKKAGEK